MRISDWSSDVCSSDLLDDPVMKTDQHVASFAAQIEGCGRAAGQHCQRSDQQSDHGVSSGFMNARNRDRKSVVEGKSVSVRVDLGGRRIIKKKKNSKRKQYKNNMKKQKDHKRRK